jgi:hypothetical protein
MSFASAVGDDDMEALLDAGAFESGRKKSCVVSRSTLVASDTQYPTAASCYACTKDFMQHSDDEYLCGSCVHNVRTCPKCQELYITASNSPMCVTCRGEPSSGAAPTLQPAVKDGAGGGKKKTTDERSCVSCTKRFVTFSGNPLCLECRSNPAATAAAAGATAAAAAGSAAEETDERSCTDCQKRFVTYSGNPRCLECRAGVSASTGTVSLSQASEQQHSGERACQDCRNRFITFSGNPRCLECRKHPQQPAAAPVARTPRSRRGQSISKPDNTQPVNVNADLFLRQNQDAAAAAAAAPAAATPPSPPAEQHGPPAAAPERAGGQPVRICVCCSARFVSVSGKDHCLKCRQHPTGLTTGPQACGAAAAAAANENSHGNAAAAVAAPSGGPAAHFAYF